MSSCKLDHPVEDVRKKLADQKTFLPVELVEGTSKLLDQGPSQQVLNEVFHLLKKYDLSSKEEQQSRNEQLKKYI
ncbi:group-specific protein [Bacillus sp. FJAT-45350]|uniref:group-specific protein n=1 Tax=Bacillus sp. FJAT-45350 TaxID=2011014 RepID=UPI000BB8A023|nr:group-specific protein [Bacillus sp. FJAT-45350]